MACHNGCKLRNLLVIAWLGLTSTVQLWAEDPTQAESGRIPDVQDIVLLEDNVMLGQAVDDQGSPAANARLSVLREGRAVVHSQTARDGSFAVSGLSTGVYQVTSSGAVTTIRLWKPQVAPPTARSEAVILSPAATAPATAAATGPARRTRWLGVLSNPWVVGGLAAGAIAIPLALDDDDSPRNTAPAQNTLDVPDAS
jgi:hypothetical protein